MKTQHFIAGILAIFVLSGYVLGQNGWTDDGGIVRLTTSTDKVRIGTNSNYYKLAVVDSTAGLATLLFSNRNTVSGSSRIWISSLAGDAYQIFRVPGPQYWAIGIDQSDNNKFKIDHSSTVGAGAFTIQTNGNVGIGTTTVPSGYKLAVDGKIIAEEVKVEMSGDWPDNVFRSDYNLKPLDEVEAYIKANRHLSDMPSAAEVAENGVSLGDMQARLLQKVEELTLYVIDLKKENEALKGRVRELEQ